MSAKLFADITFRDNPNTHFGNMVGDGKDEWLTPIGIVRALGEFDLDPCAPVNRPWPTAFNHYTIDDDGLSRDWLGRVWCNPPYSDASAWLERMADHGDGIALVFARTETQMFFQHVWNKADGIFFFEGRIAFYHVSGQRAAMTAGAPSCLVAYGANNVTAIQSSGLRGRLIGLNTRA